MDVKKLMAGLDALIERTNPVNPLSTITIEVRQPGLLRRFKACEKVKGVFVVTSGDIVQKRLTGGAYPHWEQWELVPLNGLTTYMSTPPYWGDVYSVSLETFKKVCILVEFSLSDLKG